ncbi:MAG: 50S ribosomal protein L6 [Caldilineaceae bacterium]|uniref:Large ribosomal subunit protein uL6 n=1 Tax=Caldilineaceae bacterium SB0661_bin_32 TaxID=2605255 RepID=A0A6B1D377_9CHLR|nr:50S ribosomal protein L6 [Caldilineaceae bacterium]MDE0633424.1 50S ribosomal protein L6 [Caldilineaceae bacterium]MYC94046.1 50S ribosomal protein L6 [Caldilineaceae bacterium SB0661_bin_32]
MSRIGKMPISVPAGVTVDIVTGNVVTVKGPKGELSQKFNRDMRISRENGEIVVTRPTDQRQHRALHGLTRSLLNNMVVGVTDGFKRTLEIHGVGYRAQQEGKNLLLQVGKSHAVEYAPPSPDVEFEVSRDGRTVTISGIDKQQIGELAAKIRKERPPEPYKGKGIRYQGEYVRSKAGKAGAAAV